MKKKFLHGFSLGELLVVCVIIGLLAVIVLVNYQKQIARANDAKRKTDLKKFQTAFEDYYGDNNCYPSETAMNAHTSCDSAVLAPYLDKFPCDPVTRIPYLYTAITDEDGGACRGYRLLTTLQDWGDQDILRVGCSQNPRLGCGFVPPQYNYGISMGDTIYRAGLDPNEIPSDLPNGGKTTGTWACNANGTCNNKDPSVFPAVCPIGFATSEDCVRSGCPNLIRCKN